MGQMPVVRVSRRGADRLRSGHPWVFRSDILHSADAAPGDAVRVLDPRGKLLGTAHYSSTSQIVLRLLSRRAEEIGREFFLRRLAEALDHRRQFVSGTDAFRLVHGEADMLPGLVVDKYGDYVVMQTLNQGMDRSKDVVAACLSELLKPKAIVARNDAAVREKESLPVLKEVLAGEVPHKVPIHINGLTLGADLLGGQKTGIFLDQRENYRAAARYAHGKALDCFTGTGGFALHMASRCESVEAADSSAAALETAEANRRENRIENVSFRQADCFELLAGYAAAGRRFSTVVLDPPAFAKSRGSLDGAVRGYREINRRALQLLDPGGILITCSCSQLVSEAALLDVLAAASQETGRRLRLLERRTQSIDHPILLAIPETHYLKCLILQVVRDYD